MELRCWKCCQQFSLEQWFLTFVTRMFLNCNSQKPQPAQWVVKASGSCSPKLLSNPRLRTSDLEDLNGCHLKNSCHFVADMAHLFSSSLPYQLFFIIWFCYGGRRMLLFVDNMYAQGCDSGGRIQSIPPSLGVVKWPEKKQWKLFWMLYLKKETGKKCQFGGRVNRLQAVLETTW